MGRQNVWAATTDQAIRPLACTPEERDIFFALALDMSCIAGFNGYFLQLSSTWEDLLGFRLEELKSKPFIEFVHPDDQKATIAETEKLRQGIDTVAFENRFLCKDGTYKWLLWHATASLEKQQYYAYGRDITDIRQAESALRDSESLYRDLIESSHDLLQSIAPDGHFYYVNGAWFETLGYTEVDLPQLNLFDIIHPDFHPHCHTMLAKIMAGESFKEIQVTFITKDGRSIPVEGNASGRLVDGKIVATHAFFRDITERKRAEKLAEDYRHKLEEEVELRTSELVQSEKLATLGRLTAGIAHEIKNPLNFVNNFSRLSVNLADELVQTLEAHHDRPVAEVLAEVQELLDDLKFNAEKIHQHGARADGIVRAMMQHAASGTGKREATDINRLVAANIDLAYHGKRAQVPGFISTIERDLDKEAPSAEIIPQEIGRVLLNLLDNAFDAVHEHASKMGGEYAPTVTVSTRQINGSVEIRVQDNGPGIPEAIKDRIFEPFFTTKPTGTGTGLGLSLSYDIVTQGHGGTLTVESGEGEGATFIITLPHEAKPTDGVNPLS